MRNTWAHCSQRRESVVAENVAGFLARAIGRYESTTVIRDAPGEGLRDRVQGLMDSELRVGGGQDWRQLPGSKCAHGGAIERARGQEWLCGRACLRYHGAMHWETVAARPTQLSL